MYWVQVTLSIILMLQSGFIAKSQDQIFEKGKIIYANDLSRADHMQGWRMEGPGETEFRDGWMHMFAHDQKWHHVFWCPVDFPDSFIAEWEMQNHNLEAGLCIVFFATTGLQGEDIFDPSLPTRDGTFRQYTKEKIRGYHISYYANNPNNTEREASHLRKNNMFETVQKGPEGILKNSTDVHHIRLIKNGPHIVMYVDERKIMDWIDDGVSLGPVYGSGKIGFRQMQWSHFRYRNFKVWSIAK